MPLEEEKGKIKSDSGTPNGAVEEESGVATTVATEYASFNIAPAKFQPQPSVNQRVQYQEIDPKKTKVSWSHMILT